MDHGPRHRRLAQLALQKRDDMNATTSAAEDTTGNCNRNE